MENNTFEATDVMKRLFDEHLAYLKLRNRYIKIPIFGHRLAVKYAIKAQQKHSSFWKQVKDAYPELRLKSMSYSPCEGFFLSNDS